MSPRARVLHIACAAAVSLTVVALEVVRRRRRARQEAIRFNFGAASSRDALAYGALRPGKQANAKEEPGSITDAEVAEWVGFMRARGITRVLSLLGDDEVAWYQSSLDDTMRRSFKSYHRTSVFDENALRTMLAALDATRASGERIVMHCSGGTGRAALALGLWLVRIHGLAPDDAAREIVAAAAEDGTKRQPNAEKLATLIDKGQLPRKKK